MTCSLSLLLTVRRCVRVLPSNQDLPRQVAIGPLAAERGWNRRHRQRSQPSAAREPPEFAGFEAEPYVCLLSHRLVVVTHVIEHDERASGTTQLRELPDHLCRARRVMQNTRGEHDVRA